MSGPSAATLERQALASNPHASAWVSANAGSGKTYVLVQRVVRLLLSGADPSRILCLTFTKAAAANMQNRVVERLRGWATMPDEALAAEVAKLEGAQPSRAHLARARRLFAQALETPGGLKIYTIHAFCGRLLRQFPFEANVPAGFAEIDERDQAEMMARARARVLARAARDPEGPLGAALGYLVPRVAAQTIDDAVAEAVGGRDDLRRLFDDPAVGGPDGAARALGETFDLAPHEDAEALEAAILGAGLPAEEWPAIAHALAEGTTTDGNLAACFLKAVAAGDETERREAYLSVFLTATGQPRAPNRFVTKGTRAAFPNLATMLDGERERLAALLPRRAAARIVARTRALLTLADATTAEYARAKSAEALLDYDDLIAKTRNLLARTESAWVLFKLDGGLDHVLVDEAQDTAPAQWEIVRRLTEEFLAGAGARGGDTRTVFAVGDEKQSIFSFQGAEPAIFGEVRSAYARGHQAVDLRFDDVRLQESFRSTPAVLAGVDAVFALENARKGLSSDAAGTAHSTTRVGAPGSVELWPLVAAAPAAHADEAWDAPFDAVKPASAVVRLAERIAEEIARAIASGETPAGEILVLVRQRKALFEAVLRSLKSKGVPVAGADRLIVGEHIAVMDLLALGDALTTPDDDLALACALKSPLFGLTDDDLMAIAPGRGMGRLRDALGDGPPRAQAAHDRLAALAHDAAGRTPFAFYADLIARGGARKAYRARLGHEVDDPLDAFLDLAQDHSTTHAPTLAGFLGWMRAAPAEIKRDLDVSSGEVRVMTVHGAKGLEAGLVVLADTCGGAASGRGSALIDVARAGAGHGAAKIPVWAGRKEDDPPALSSARALVRAEAEAEHRRLLYVAMTRAKDRLIVCGHDSGRARPEGAWYDLVREGLAAAEGVETIEQPEGGALYRLATGGPFVGASQAEEKASADDETPDWLFAPVAHEEAPGPPLSPSALVADDDAGPAPAGPGAEAARARGVLLHRLLKTLPEVAPERRAEAAARLSRRTPGLDDALKAECAAAARRIVDDPAFAAVFSGAGRGEVPIVGRLRDGRAVSGRIDRLAVTDAEILVVDYKTDRRPPPPGAIPAGYAAQLAAYAELLAEIWPERTVKAAILWTAAPRLEVLPLLST
ncbi:ATP-dependent helicase/nuclease subunit A [Methylopila capsulata]|uniref:DNA 3'-5' helicase n=1 Tax=Methylopila capsulata TaxID=61654 RepID=A0A9W6IRK1_9HYPH|nr:double-strand break repair helicase AddA [Methylopila capsulata]MBM7851201.1 ATP-dependent helicase/nuclease subunit A [Methylopila capsulata]GLK54259.1 double-strand break repair helicase AddA [Methylopila capsulata]